MCQVISLRWISTTSRLGSDASEAADASVSLLHHNASRLSFTSCEISAMSSSSSFRFVRYSRSKWGKCRRPFMVSLISPWQPLSLIIVMSLLRSSGRNRLIRSESSDGRVSISAPCSTNRSTASHCRTMGWTLVSKYPTITLTSVTQIKNARRLKVRHRERPWAGIYELLSTQDAATTNI